MGVAVIPNETVKDGLIVVVPDNQLSLAIGKRGKNARLAVKLTNHKIDIKSETEMQELGIDYMAISAKMQQEYEEKKAKERDYKQQQKIEELKSNESEIENIDVADFTYEDEEVDAVEEHAEDTLFEKENTVKDAEQEKEVDEMEEAARIAKQNRKEKTAADVKEYTSKFESMADASNKQEEVVSKPKKEKEKVEEEKKPVEVKKFNYEDMKPIYSEEELAEIEEQEYEEENAWDDDVDYEEYDEYYDD